MVEVRILDKVYPLCLTVAALDDINSKCGGLGKIGQFLDGRQSSLMIRDDQALVDGGVPNMTAMAVNTAWLLAVLIREGENNRLMRAKFADETAERRPVPTADDLRQVLTIASALKYRKAVFETISESMEKDIEAVYPKNADAGQE